MYASNKKSREAYDGALSAGGWVDSQTGDWSV